MIDLQSSKEPRKFVFIEGTKAVIKYYAFGIHLESGMKVYPVDKTKSHIVEVRMLFMVGCFSGIEQNYELISW